MRMRVVVVVTISIAMLLFLAFSTSHGLLGITPPVGMIILTPVALYIFYVISVRLAQEIKNRPHRMKRKIGLYIYYIISLAVFVFALPVSFWFGGAFGGYIGEILATAISANGTVIFLAFYAVILTSVILMSISGMFLAIIADRVVVKLI